MSKQADQSAMSVMQNRTEIKKIFLKTNKQNMIMMGPDVNTIRPISNECTAKSNLNISNFSSSFFNMKVIVIGPGVDTSRPISDEYNYAEPNFK